MVQLLSRVLEVPLRGRNELLTAAGFAPVYRETGLDAPEMAQVKQALGFMLRQQEPCPAMVLDRHWNILMTNEAMGRVMGLFLDPAAAAALGPANAMRLSYHPQGLRPYIVNWERPRRPSSSGSTAISCAPATLRHAACSTAPVLSDVPRQWQVLDLDASTAPFLAIELKKGDVRFSFFTLLASLARRTTSRCTSSGSSASSPPTRRPTRRFAGCDGLRRLARRRLARRRPVLSASPRT